MTILEDRLPWLDRIQLGRGTHPGANGEACVMEAVSYVAGEAWSDHPACASPIITTFLVAWNDAMNDADRQMLKPYVLRLAGTRTTEADEVTRAWLLTDWLARECAPAWLRLAGLTERAEALEALAPLVSSARAKAAQPTLTAAGKDSAAAWAAAGDAAWDAAWAAAWAAAGAAAWAAARAAAGAAAWDAAWAAAWDAAWAAARAAAWAALAPTTKALQVSALFLLDRLIAVGQPGEAVTPTTGEDD